MPYTPNLVPTDDFLKELESIKNNTTDDLMYFFAELSERITKKSIERGKNPNQIKLLHDLYTINTNCFISSYLRDYNVWNSKTIRMSCTIDNINRNIYKSCDSNMKKADILFKLSKTLDPLVTIQELNGIFYN